MGLIARGTDSAKVVKVIKTIAMRGAGTNESPVRTVAQYWDFNGELLAENDGFFNDIIKDTIGEDTDCQMVHTKVLKENLEKVQNNVCKSLAEGPETIDMEHKRAHEDLIQKLRKIREPSHKGSLDSAPIGLCFSGDQGAKGIVIFDKYHSQFVFNRLSRGTQTMTTTIWSDTESMAKDIEDWFFLKEVEQCKYI